MPVSHEQPLQDNPSLREIRSLRENLLQEDPEEVADALPEIERKLFVAVNDFGRSLFQEVLEHLDVDEDGIVVDGERYRRRKGKTPGTYFSRFGKMCVLRSTFRKRGSRGSESVVPLELRAGFVGNSWTLEAAKAVSTLLAMVPPKQVCQALKALGCLTPSTTHLDLLPKIFNDKWEQNRKTFEAALRETRDAPDEEEVAVVLLSKDGIMAPMKDAPREKDPEKADTGPKGYQECGCATISLFNAEGSRLRTFSCARMPEPGKVTVGEWLECEARWAQRNYPNAVFVAVADGAKDNWKYFDALEERLGIRLEMVLDFWHAMEHIANALRRYRGRHPTRARQEIQRYRRILRDEPQGFQRVIQALEYRYKRSRGTVRSDIADELAYLRRNARRMRYHRHGKRNLPIGSGIQEAACKTLVAQRLKLSGMAWRHRGGQGILTLRTLARSGRLSEAWDLLRPSLRRPFSVDENKKRKRFVAAS